MQATITYLLTEEAQRAQMATTGQPVARTQTITVEITAEDLPLCTVAADGSLSVDTAHQHARALKCAGWTDDNPTRATVYQPDVLADIRRGRAMMADAYTAACQIASQYILDTPDDTSDRSYRVDVPFAVLDKSVPLDQADKIERKWNGYAIRITDLSTKAQQALEDRKSARHAAWLAESGSAVDKFLADADARLGISYAGADVRLGSITIGSANSRYSELAKEAMRRNAADEATKKAKDAEVEAAKRDYIDTWISEHADEATKAQHDEGLLCRATAVALIADAAFVDAGVGDKAKWDDNYCDQSGCPCGSMDLECLPRSVYAAWRTLKDTLPEDYEVEFSRVRECLRGEDWDGEGESAGPARYMAKITIPHGPFSFVRTVELSK